MDCMLLYRTDATGISMHESHLAQTMHPVFGVVVVNLLAPVLLEVTVDVSLEVVAVIHHHAAGRAVDDLVESVVMVPVHENCGLHPADEILASLYIGHQRFIFFLASSTPADRTEIKIISKVYYLVWVEPFKELVELLGHLRVDMVAVVIAYGHEFNHLAHLVLV